MALSPMDPNSFSRPDLTIVTHTHLSVDVNFDEQVLEGHVILDVKKKGSSNTLILDIRGLILLSIVNYVDESNLTYSVGESVHFGSKLSIKLPESRASEADKNKAKIKIQYKTSPNSSALLWLTPEQTANGEDPYLFSQCEPIFCRSMLPCQDTPSVKSTYSAEITAPRKFTVLMSGLHDETQEIDDNKTMHKFHQSIPIPSYLIAITVAVLVSKEVSPRTKMWSEKKSIDAAAYEFAETEQLLKTAEEICGPYVWGRYDLLVLPPSFPFGGMENPCLTYVSPSTIAGDRSLATIIAHEISHSWTGNLVTNANFEHFWLNEGFTVFIERKIRGRILGERNRQFEAIMGLQDLNDAIQVFGETSEYTKLVTNLTGIDPMDIYSEVPYEKGHTFLYYLEELLGGPAEFEPFLISFVNKFKYKSVVTSDFKDHLYSFFSNKTQALNSVDWNSWLYGPGHPPVIPKYDRSLLNTYLKLADKWSSPSSNKASFSKEDIVDFSPSQKAGFLNELIVRNVTLTVEQVGLMQDLYDFDKSRNSEIRVNWLRLCLKARWEAKVPDALEFAVSLGRMKLIRPIFRDLYEWKEMRERTIETYEKHRSKMMFVTREAIAADLHLHGY